jgi:hypothetical protein
VTWEIKPDAEHVGGLAVFGKSLGCYPVDPTVILTFDKTHGLDENFKSDKTVAVRNKND